LKSLEDIAFEKGISLFGIQFVGLITGNSNKPAYTAYATKKALKTSLHPLRILFIFDMYYALLIGKICVFENRNHKDSSFRKLNFPLGCGIIILHI
jgi:hypothetical protein